MKWTGFLHGGANSGKQKVISMGLLFQKLKSYFKFSGGPAQKWAWSFSSWDPKICWISLWIELIFCMLIVMQYFLVRPTLYSISLTSKYQFTSVLLARPLAVAGRIPWNRVCPSLPPEICLDVFLELDH